MLDPQLSRRPLARDFTALVYDAAHDRMVLHGGNGPLLSTGGGLVGTEVLGDVWTISLPATEAPILVANTDPEAFPDLVRVRWHVTALDRSYQVQRREGDGAWTPRGSVTAGDGGYLTYEDADVRGGATYAYRLQYEDRAQTRVSTDTRVLVPLEYSLRLDAAPLIRGTRLQVELTLPSAQPAHLAVYDVSGRRVADVDTGSLPAGRHVVDFGSSTQWGPGVYWVRLERGPVALQRRVVLLR